VKVRPAEKDRRAGTVKLLFYTKREQFTLVASTERGAWLNTLFGRITPDQRDLMSLQALQEDFEKKFSSAFSSFLRSREWKTLREKGLLLI
jgi:hypothetical protein